MATMQQRVQHKVFAARAEKGTQPNTNVFVLSTDKPDRDGDRLNQRGWDLTAYRQNPIVLFGHDHKSLPIGKCTSIDVVNGKLKGTIEWPPPGVHPFADTVHALVDGGFLSAASVGFRAGDGSEPNPYGGRDISEPELCEWSIVPIPSNTDAQVERGVDRVRLKSWLSHNKEEQDMDTEEKWLELDDDFETKDDDPFQAMCDSMLSAYSEMEGEKFRQLMARQLALLGPAASIADLVRSIMQQGVAAPKSFDVDEKELATVIAQVIASEMGKQTRAAFNQALGRLD